MPLKQLGPYTIEKVLGRGGMGTVYQARHGESGEHAAIKVLSHGLADDPRFRERFINEIETLKKLRHPHIVQLLGYGEHEGHLFFSMELIHGRSLQEELQSQRRFHWREVTRLGTEICSALKHAHDHGVIHRDLKPANLLLDADEHVKLTDFGIAKLFGMSHLTGDGNVIGTADYMAPEQAEGQPVTARTDLYSLGSVLYALLVSKPPFASPSLPQVIHGLRFDKPRPVRQLAPETPAELEHIIDELLEKDPHERIGTALALSNRLRAMEHGLSIKSDAGESEEAADVGRSRSSSRRNVAEADQEPDELPGWKTTNRPTVSHEEAGSVEQQSLSGTDETLVTVPPEDSELKLQAEEPAAPQADHFTTVERKRRTSEADAVPSDDGAPLWAMVTAAVVVSAILIAGLFYVLQSPTADELYERITTTVAEASPDQLLAVEEDVELFLQQYPEDDRAAEVAAIQEEIELARRQRQLERRMRFPRTSAELSTLERTYLETLQLAHTNPEAALVRFQALIDVYGGDPDGNEATLRTVELAREQVERLQTLVDSSSRQQRTLIERQLSRAEELQHEDPQAARAIRRGVIQLYQDKPWAEELVERARASLRAAAETTPPMPADQ